jgi:hypothetical protein
MTNQHAFYALENLNGETVSVNLSKTLRPELFAFLEKICRFDYRFNVVFRLASRLTRSERGASVDSEISFGATEYRGRVRRYLHELYGLNYGEAYQVSDAIIDWAWNN